MKITYIYLIVIFFLASCKPDPLLSDLKSGIVNGIVLDKTTNVGIVGATVFLLGNEGGGTWGGGGTPSFLIDQTVSDSNGFFSFEFEYDDEFGYYCSAIAQNYFNYNTEVAIDNQIVGQNNVVVELNPIAYLSIHFQNVLPALPTDQFGINGMVTDGFIGNNIDTTVIYEVNGNLLNVLHWAVGYEPTISDTLYCPSFDTTYFEILY